MPAIDVKPLHPELGARMTGLDLSGDLDDAAVATIR